jgi:hypothetical protein
MVIQLPTEEDKLRCGTLIRSDLQDTVSDSIAGALPTNIFLPFSFINFQIPDVT